MPPRVSRPWIACAVLVWVISGALGPPDAPDMTGVDYQGEVTLLTDVHAGRFGPWAIGHIAIGSVLVELPEGTEAGRGDSALTTGEIEGEAGVAGGHSYSAVLDVREVHALVPSRFPPHRAGNWLRGAVDDALRPYDDGRALLAGFLIGDTSHVRDGDIEAMRRSGLAHFVAVSGSNVALFLGFLAVVTGPLSMGPKRRAILGLLGLPVYVAATRFEPSVIRAAFMAGIALTGRILGVVLEAWQLLSLAVVVLVLSAPGLAGNVGFQLSVAATAGVLVGARWPLRSWAGRALAITLGAQLAVGPLLLIHFGSIPLMSPLVNLVAAPLVTAATLAGAIGVVGLDLALEPAGWMAEGVLVVARAASGWPQIGWIGLASMVTASVAAHLRPRLRPLLAVPAAAVLVLLVVSPPRPLPSPGAVVLDVGQGDSILLAGGDGRFALVDGGPEPEALLAKLAEYGITHLDLVVLSHVHADHAAGLVGLVGVVSVEEVWLSIEPHHTAASDALTDALAAHDIAITAPAVGQRYELGELEILVEGPVRRYASPNDQSIVLTIYGPARSLLLTGDIETIAQQDLDHLEADVLKVPHQGAATSDSEWLTTLGAETAVISVGPNNFGHPAAWVIDVLIDSGAAVYRTDETGDVVVELGSESGK